MRFDKARLSNGLRIHYAESGDARGTPVVFVHGWPDSWFSFSRVLRLLPATLRLIALDQRGFGESDHPDSGYTIPGFAADLVALLDALEIDRAVLVGHSDGSFVARRAAIAAPERVAALGLIGTGASTKITGADDLQAALRELPDPIPEPFARVPVGHGVSPGARRVLRPHHRGEPEDSAAPLAGNDRLPSGL